MARIIQLFEVTEVEPPAPEVLKQPCEYFSAHLAIIPAQPLSQHKRL